MSHRMERLKRRRERLQLDLAAARADMHGGYATYVRLIVRLQDINAEIRKEAAGG